VGEEGGVDGRTRTRGGRKEGEEREKGGGDVGGRGGRAESLGWGEE